jgi:hypothetical protein
VRGRSTTAPETRLRAVRHGSLHREHGNWTAALLGDVPKRAYANLTLNHWLALTPRVLVEAHLEVDTEVVAGLSTAKMSVLPK